MQFETTFNDSAALVNLMAHRDFSLVSDLVVYALMEAREQTEDDVYMEVTTFPGSPIRVDLTWGLDEGRTIQIDEGQPFAEARRANGYACWTHEAEPHVAPDMRSISVDLSNIPAGTREVRIVLQ